MKRTIGDLFKCAADGLKGASGRTVWRETAAIRKALKEPERDIFSSCFTDRVIRNLPQYPARGLSSVFVSDEFMAVFWRTLTAGCAAVIILAVIYGVRYVNDSENTAGKYSTERIINEEVTAMMEKNLWTLK